jgi:hypothetical protein
MITRLKKNIYLTIYGVSLLTLIMIWSGPQLFTPVETYKTTIKEEPELPIVYVDSASSGPIDNDPRSVKPEPVVEPKVTQIEPPLSIFSFIKEITSSIIAIGNIILLFYQIRDKKKTT